MPIQDADKNLYFVIPSAIDLTRVVQSNPPGFDYKLDNFYYILDYICTNIEYADLWESEGYVFVHSKTLQKYVRNYNQYLTYLVDQRILTCDNTFILGEKSRGYIITARYFSVSTQKIPVTLPSLRRKIRADILAEFDTINEARDRWQYLTRWFNDNLTIDYPQAINEINALFPELKIGGAISGRRRGANPAELRYKATRAATKIKEGHFYYKVDSNIGRFHSNLTNLKRELRQYLSYDGVPLVNVDITNSQPLLSAVLLQPEFYTGELPINLQRIPSVKRLFKNTQEYKTTFNSCRSFITLANSPENLAGREFSHFSCLVQTGQFYPEAFKLMYPGQDYRKKMVKEAIFVTFFSSNRFFNHLDAAPKRAFASAFPNLYEVFRILKEHNKAVLSHLLQRIESIIMIETVSRRIGEERPNLPIFTVHDSILTTKGNEAYVATIILEEIQRLTGLQAKVKYE